MPFVLAVCIVIWNAPRSVAQQNDFFQTFIYRIGGETLTAGDEIDLARYDVVTIARSRYSDINGDTWGTLRSLNPRVRIYLYQLGPASFADADDYPIIWLNNLGRWDVARGHSMGSLHIDNPELILLDAAGNYITNPSNPREIFHDIGASGYQEYWIEATINDLANQPWSADGVYVDGCTMTRCSMGDTSPVRYPSDDSWSSAMNRFVNAITEGLHGVGMAVSCLRAGTTTAFGYDKWIELDRSSSPPDVVGEEGAFAVSWGTGDVHFYSEAEWKRQVDLMGQISNSEVHYQSHCDMYAGGDGIDNCGKPVTFWDVFWYAMGSYQLGKRHNSYFGFQQGAYNDVFWYDEYDHLDLGTASAHTA